MYNVKSLLLTLCTLLLALLPQTVLADFSWSVPQGDQSIQYLSQIFGTMGSVLTGTTTSLIGPLFQIFNIAVLALGSLVVSYTIIVSTINTAQEGEMMGKKWSSMWIPIRCFTGMAFLLPTASGYSLIQILMMQFVVLGVAAADQIWAQVYGSISGNTSPAGGNLTINVSQSQLNTDAQNLLNTMVCAQVFNTDPNCTAALGGSNLVSSWQNGNQFTVGIPGDPVYGNLCGGIQAAAPPSGVAAATWNSQNMAAFELAANGLSANVSQIMASSNPSTWTLSNPISNTAAILSSIASAQTNTTTNSSTQTNNNTSGWLFAGSYYFSLVNGTGTTSTGASTQSTTTFAAPSTFDGNVSSIFGGNPSVVGYQCASSISNYNARTAQYVQTTQSSAALSASSSTSSTGGSSSGSSTSSSTSGSTTLQLTQPNLNSYGLQLYNAITSPIRGLTEDILTYLTTNAGDPISSLRAVGSEIMIVTETMWFAIMITAFLILIGACIMSGVNPLCWALGVMLTVLVPLLTLMISLLWAAGAAIGLYLPLVPYIVFTFTALGWFLLVIEAIAAAPIVALGLVSPAAETLGKASAAVTIIADVFLRPSLMIIGFVAAINLAQAIIGMVNYGFSATVNASTGGIGLFGCIALIALYGGLAIAIIHECFSLVYILPDKIMRWIGGQAGQSTVKQQLQEIKQAVDKGGEMGSSLMKSSSSKVAGMAMEKTKGSGGGSGKPPNDITL